MAPQARILKGDAADRLHLQHGPIDLIIGVDGPMRFAAFEAARRRFETILDELVSELPVLKHAASPDMPKPSGAVARRMVAAVRPLSGDRFITPMAAVAGSVADEILHAMLDGLPPEVRPGRAYVNNGGDIAVHLDGVADFTIRIAEEDNATLGHFRLDGTSPARGIATSGRGGRSLSMGIADSVTVIAATAAAADAAATLVANAVDLPDHPAIIRARAIDVVDDSDLGDRMVVLGCGLLLPDEIDGALKRGAEEASRLIGFHLVEKAALFLSGQGRIVRGKAASVSLPAEPTCSATATSCRPS